MDVDRSITADDVIMVVERLIAERGAPGFVRMDNGPELIAWALRRLVPPHWNRDDLHRTRLALGEPLDRIV